MFWKEYSSGIIYELSTIFYKGLYWYFPRVLMLLVLLPVFCQSVCDQSSLQPRYSVNFQVSSADKASLSKHFRPHIWTVLGINFLF